MKLKLIFVILFFFIGFSVNAQDDPCNGIKSQISSYEEIISDYEEREKNINAVIQEINTIPHNEETPILYNSAKDKLDKVKKAKSEAIATKIKLEADLRACEKS